MKKRLLIAVLIMGFVVFSLPLNAQEDDSERTTDRTDREAVTQQRQDNQDRKAALKCERAQARLQRHLDNSDEINRTFKRTD